MLVSHRKQAAILWSTLFFRSNLHLTARLSVRSGPLEATIDDFWRMAWEHCCELMIMLTNLEEVGRTKCAKYWPEEGETTYGAITVSLAEEKPYSGRFSR